MKRPLLADADGLAQRISFQKGDAESLPFDSNSFDVTLSFTVMEEVDLDVRAPAFDGSARTGSVRAEEVLLVRMGLSIAGGPRLQERGQSDVPRIGCALHAFCNKSFADVSLMAAPRV